MIVDRIFDAAPRPFEQENPNREYLTYESFIYFMCVLRAMLRAVFVETHLCRVRTNSSGPCPT
jgi:hypothetical protein